MAFTIKDFCPLQEPCQIGKSGLCTRYECEVAYKCDDCGWIGMLKEAVHTYRDDGTGEDVEPTDECPNCGMDDLREYNP